MNTTNKTKPIQIDNPKLYPKTPHNSFSGSGLDSDFHSDSIVGSSVLKKYQVNRVKQIEWET